MSDNFLEKQQIRNLPPYGKLFVGIFTSLMLLVCFWAVWIFYETSGKVGEGDLPLYLKADSVMTDSASLHEELVKDIEEIASDSEAVQAPVWDSFDAGEDIPLDSAEVARIALMALAQQKEIDAAQHVEEESHFRHNLGLAHTHVNGQTLLFFAIGFVFLFTSAPVTTKKILFWLFGLTIVAHTVGLTGQGYCWVYDDLLAISGVLLLGIIAYMAFLIFVDLGKKPVNE
ncbi:MAG: hypothetical protein IPH75_07315 [bacterium]|nr:hypothetical protein [bacterium]